MPLIRAELQRRRLPSPGPLIHNLSQVLYLPFDQDDGSYARDRGGYNNHGTIYGTTLAAAKIGMARSFDGVDDYVLVPHNRSIDLIGDFTILFWLKTTTTELDQIYHKRADGIGYECVIKNGMMAYALVDVDLTSIKHYGTKIANDDEWHHHAIIRSLTPSPTVTLYFDGDVDVSEAKTVDGSLENSSDLYWARHPTLLRWFTGMLDEVRIYNQALSQAEIRRLMYLRGV